MSLKLYNILIVDDSVTNLQVVGNMLDKSIYNVSLAQSAKEALGLLEKKIPDVILLDIMMPVMDGFAFKRKLNENSKWDHIPVIVISALHEQADKSVAFDIGCVDYMVKPIVKSEVINRINVQLRIKEQHDVLRSVNKELSTANSTREKIFSIISHDLRTSVGNVRNVFKFMIDGLIDPDEDKELIQDAEITSRNTYNLLENLLFWAKSQQGQIIYRPEIVNVSRVIGQVVDIEKGSLITKNIECKNTIDPGLFVWTDQVLFTIIIRNLFANAIKFSNEGGEISIEAKELQNTIEISVTDNGVGINNENLEKLKSLTIFTTVGTMNEKGTGLGLVLVKDCINKCNGKFHINSELGKGSKFSFELPIEKE